MRKIRSTPAIIEEHVDLLKRPLLVRVIPDSDKENINPHVVLAPLGASSNLRRRSFEGTLALSQDSRASSWREAFHERHPPAPWPSQTESLPGSTSCPNENLAGNVSFGGGNFQKKPCFGTCPKRAHAMSQTTMDSFPDDHSSVTSTPEQPSQLGGPSRVLRDITHHFTSHRKRSEGGSNRRESRRSKPSGKRGWGRVLRM